MQKIDTLSPNVDDMLASGLVRAGGDSVFTVEEVDWSIRFLQKNPLVFMKEVLDMKYITPKMQEIVNHIADNRYTLVRSGHSVGKSWTLAGVVIWYLETHENSMVFTTAPTGRQVTEILWREIFKHRENGIVPLGGKFMRDRLRYSESWQGIGFASNKAVAFQGRHAKNMLWVLDEADGIEEEIWESIRSTISGKDNKLVAVGNPINRFSRFKKEQDLRPQDTFVISSYESPNIILTEDGYETDEIAPGCATMEWIQDWVDEFGEGSDEVLSRIMGEYPKSHRPNSILTVEEIEGAEDTKHIQADWLIIGVDVAYDGDDKSCLTFLTGNGFLSERVEISKHDGRALKDETVKWVNKFRADGKIVTAIIYDAGGIATAYSEYLQDEYLNDSINIVPILFGSAPTFERVESKEGLAHLMANKRAEMYFDFRREVRGKRVHIPKSLGLQEEMPRILYQTNSIGKFQIQAKNEIKKELGHSPDLSDSMILALHGKMLGYTVERGIIDVAI